MDRKLEDQLDDLVGLSHEYGRNPDFVLAGGGNTSFKTADLLWIKPSGLALADIRREDFARLDRRALAAMWQESYPADPAEREARVLADLLASRLPGEEGKRPSVESSLHDLLKAPFVVHTHPALVNGLSCSRGGEAEMRRVLGEEALWIPTVNPGYILAALVRERVQAYRERHGRAPQVLVLQNHGLCVCGGSAQEIRTVTERVVAALGREIRRQPDAGAAPFDRERACRLAPAVRMLLMGEDPHPPIVVFHADRELAERLRSAESFAGVSTALTPDHIVYAGAEPLFIGHRADLEEQYRLLQEELAAYRRRAGLAPRVVAVQGLGVFCAGPTRPAAGQTLAVLRDALRVAAYAESFGGLQPMPPEQVAFIQGWEVEFYRRQAGAGARPPGRLAGKIAVVTGSGRGFGQGIAAALAAEGACVAGADLDGEAARNNAAELCRRFGAGRAIGVKADVAREEEVRALVEEAVLEYGGLDLLVSNAGVLRAGSLEELSLEEFELVNRINYTGYFLCARQAAGPMSLQNRFRPGYLSDIVQINSKSGLAGSSRNFAYAGSKFAGIGLTQSFALELVSRGIKVNAVCPGNLFDGPLWSDPENGLFVQYLRAGKVPGARTVQDVRRYYEDKVPMGRGCRIEDVVRAVLYLVEQAYETGQALPVTGGQIMLG